MKEETPIPEGIKEGRLYKAIFPFTVGQEIPTDSEYLHTYNCNDGTIHYFLCWTREGELAPIDNPFNFKEEKDKDELF